MSMLLFVIFCFLMTACLMYKVNQSNEIQYYDKNIVPFETIQKENNISQIVKNELDYYNNISSVIYNVFTYPNKRTKDIISNIVKDIIN